MPETTLKPHFKNYNWREPFPRFQQPKIIDGFSLEQDRSFAKEPRKFLKYWRRPERGSFDFDLNLDYESYVPGPKGVHINTLLGFIGQNKSLLCPAAGKGLAADFVCYRGLLTQVFVTPYFTRDPWCVLATKYKGTVYLCNYVSPERMREYEARDTEYSIKCSYYGKNFERFVLTEDPLVQKIPTPSGPLQDIEEFNLALTTKLEGWRIIYAAEVDGVEDDSGVQNKDSARLDALRFVEVKTRMADWTEKQYQNYVKFKLPKWWCQSFLVGVDTIYAGFRSREGRVREIEPLAVSQIPKMAQGVWSPAVMVRFGADFLSTVQELMRDVECPHTVYQFSYDANKSWNVTYEVREGKNELSFLPQSHIDLLGEAE